MDLKKYLFKEEPAAMDPATARPTPVGKPTGARRPSFSIAGGAVTAPPPRVAAANPEMAADIERTLVGNTIYTTLQTQLELLEAAIPDEDLRLRTAVKSVVALSKVPEEQVVRAVCAQLDKLLQHQQEFERDLAADVAQRTQQYTNHTEDLRKQIAANEQKQRDLQAEFARLHTDLVDTDAQLSGIEAERDVVKGDFDATFAGYHQRLQAMVDRLGAR